MAKYAVTLLTPSGTPIKDLSGFNMLQWVRSENKVGVAELWYPAAKLNPGFLAVDQIIEIERNGGILNETSYFLRFAEYYMDAQRREFVHLLAYDANFLLTSRIVAYASLSSQASKSDYADDMCKEVVDENLVSATDTDRNLSNLTIAPDLSLGASINKAMAYDNVLSALRDFAQTSTDRGTYLAFDVVRTSRANFEFRTYTGQRGQDHTQGGDAGLRLIGPQYGNLQNAKVVLFDRKAEANVAYAGGRGEASDRELYEAEDTTRSKASPYNRREIFIDARNVEVGNTAQLEDKAYTGLEANKPVQTLTGNLTDTKGFRYNIHYGFGDLVSATAFGYTFDCHLDKISAIVRPLDALNNGQIEILTTMLSGEL